MITKEYGKYKLVCDMCDEEIELDTFEDAVIHKKKEGWASCNYNGVWEDYCPECYENADR